MQPQITFATMVDFWAIHDLPYFGAGDNLAWLATLVRVAGAVLSWFPQI